ncbi:MAG: 30S ribosomal protein S17 [Caldisericales bacterium]|nr:30S ribosomal protein S17 [Caldisericales bacterium]
MADKLITRTGVVTSDSMEKTVGVIVERMVTHPLYKKRVKKSRKYLVHDEHEQAKVGDVVEFIDCNPISKRVHWRLLRVVEQAKQSEVQK